MNCKQTAVKSKQKALKCKQTAVNVNKQLKTVQKHQQTAENHRTKCKQTAEIKVDFYLFNIKFPASRKWASSTCGSAKTAYFHNGAKNLDESP